MSVIRQVVPLALLFCVLGACSSLEPQPNRYQLDTEAAGASAPLGELQLQARTALALGDFQLAIDTLQRAIRIEPRNAWSWHYLGESYRRQGDFERCLSMVERAFSYAGRDDRLLRNNRRLQQKCSHG